MLQRLCMLMLPWSMPVGCCLGCCHVPWYLCGKGMCGSGMCVNMCTLPCTIRKTGVLYMPSGCI
jgi:hypothetical protein